MSVWDVQEARGTWWDASNCPVSSLPRTDKYTRCDGQFGSEVRDAFASICTRWNAFASCHKCALMWVGPYVRRLQSYEGHAFNAENKILFLRTLRYIPKGRISIECPSFIIDSDSINTEWSWSGAVLPLISPSLPPSTCFLQCLATQVLLRIWRVSVRVRDELSGLSPVGECFIIH